MSRRRLAPAVALLLAAGLSGCAANAPVAVPSPAPSVAVVFGGTDRAWIEINIAMNEELTPLLALVPAHSHDDAVKALAAQVKRVHDGETAELRALHAAAGLPAENPHKGMPMPGMVTPSIVAEAGAAEGRAFDRLFRVHVRAHLEQGVKLARSEAASGVEPRTKELAARMIGDREAFLPKLGPATE